MNTRVWWSSWPSTRTAAPSGSSICTRATGRSPAARRASSAAVRRVLSNATGSGSTMRRWLSARTNSSKSSTI
jgi:hypothetical protein